ncbi:MULTISPECIES: LacI family DNA-binding transcriptional regulator [Enterobacterales]|uniref:LacI family DNA-binding transcriptional regulator n=1 Tax=Enterobacterales TaxID=91347 RepID=UPI002ED9EB2F
MNIKELANRLGLSIATVSRALNSHPEVSAKTQQRVLNAAQQYGYFPNAAGRNLRKGKVNTVALLLPPGDRDNFYTASFFMRVANELQRTLRQHDIDTILHLALDAEDERLWLQKMIEQRKADAVILTNTTLEDPRIEFLHHHQFPFATLGRSHSLEGHFNWVDLDFATVAATAVEQGLLKGHKNFGLVTLGNQSAQGEIFAAAWREALNEKTLPLNEAAIFYGDISETTGYEAIQHFQQLATPPDYVIFLSDLQLLGATFYTQQHHISIPFFAGVFSSDMSALLPEKPTGFDIPFARLGEDLALATLNAMQQHLPPVQSLPPLKWVTRREHTLT